MSFDIAQVMQSKCCHGGHTTDERQLHISSGIEDAFDAESEVLVHAVGPVDENHGEDELDQVSVLVLEMRDVAEESDGQSGDCQYLVQLNQGPLASSFERNDIQHSTESPFLRGILGSAN